MAADTNGSPSVTEGERLRELENRLWEAADQLLTPLTEIPQGCSSKFLTLVRV